MERTALSRRELLAGSGLFLFFPLRAEREGYPSDFNAYFKIAGRVTCFVGKVELGQGSMTAIAQLVAEELEVAFDSVDMVMGDTGRCPWDIGTMGSLTLRHFGPVLRAAAAEARAVLLQMAAGKLDVPAAQLKVKDGVVSGGGRSVTYAQLVAGRRIERHIPGVPSKRPRNHSVVGTSPRRKDAREKVTGKAVYTADISLPGMLHACILRPPAHGAKLKRVDTSAAEKLPGVRVVRDGDLVAVLHARPDLARKALSVVRAEFERPPNAPGRNENDIYTHLLKASPEPQVVEEKGSLPQGESLAATVVEETYYNAYVAHAPLETHTALASLENGEMTIWASAQMPFQTVPEVAQALGIPERNVRIRVPYVGGAFCGKNRVPQVAEAARLAQLAGKPVQLVWSRAEEFFYDDFRPAAVVRIRSGLTSAGRIAFWDYCVYCAGEYSAAPFYDIPHRRTRSSGRWTIQTPGLHAFTIGSWRGASATTNNFARESHIDSLAAQAGADPVEFRVAHLSDRRMRRVLETAARRFGWEAGAGMGVACALFGGTCVTAMAQAAVDRESGRVRVKRALTAADVGQVINPDGARQQLEGGFMMGLGSALSEEIHFRDGEIFDRNFDNYAIPRFSWLPEFEPVLIENYDDMSTGCGEPPVVAVCGAIANAIHAACGARVRHLPMTPQRVRAALA